MSYVDGNCFAGPMRNAHRQLLALRQSGFYEKLMPLRQRVELAKDNAGAEFLAIRFRHSMIPMMHKIVKQR